VRKKEQQRESYKRIGRENVILETGEMAIKGGREKEREREKDR
jgi:hypothetical protein